jgi:hypothetical protein
VRALFLALLIAGCGAPAASTEGAAPQPAAGAVAAMAEVSIDARELI